MGLFRGGEDRVTPGRTPEVEDRSAPGSFALSISSQRTHKARKYRA